MKLVTEYHAASVNLAGASVRAPYDNRNDHDTTHHRILENR
jgi:hypothetical protein